MKKIFSEKVLLPILVFAILGLMIAISPSDTKSFNGERALSDVQYQVQLGPRLPGSTAHAQAVSWMQTELEKSGWQVSIQESTEMGHPIRNVIAQRGEKGQWIIVCAHYDSRLYADHDPNPENVTKPVPGANDGASGVAVLLEISRVLPEDTNLRVWLVFFDAEDQGNIPGWDWILGSTAFVRELEGKPDAVILLDMIGDADLNIKIERNSTPALALEVWDVAKKAGYEGTFIAQPGPSILDDHIPFLNAGIPAVDIIDFTYPYWHTIEDTVDKVSSKSLKIVGDTVLRWLNDRSSQ